jgi:predicted enzyme related to lactoylglutathione lyase
MGNPVVHFEVLGKDAAALQNFYRDAFDWKVESVMPTYAMAYPRGEGNIAGGIGAAPDGSSHVTFYVEVPDLDEALKKIGGLGGSTIVGPMDVPGGPSIAMFADPEGHMVGLVKAAPAGN